ncbi:MAG: amino acid ABC transporter permease [Burkholderiales bacterium]|nr:amino acid ABC transporter permease [Burkholderiales bacterium]
MIREFDLIDFYYLLLATRWTIALAALALIGGGMVGIVIATLRVSPVSPMRWIGAGYVNVVQGIPLLAWLFVFFFGIPVMTGVQVSPWIAATLALSAYTGAFLGEIWRGCLQSIPRQQWETGAALGLSFAEQLRYVIVPQAMRVAIPPSVGFVVQLIKNTSLCAVIGFVELTREGQYINAATYRPFTVYVVVAAIYFAICFPLTQWSRYLERKLHAAG